ncbi:hypothetical protein GXW78_09790 [Roseomonas terrae]|uniref:Transposase n=1 Tax=Neoroseomonas terrae TaxID=424799 RepID=A0ABS5EG00_9PROT|nr:hypothetical protein [Neoroseomonas terrae]MBR0649954.1 hypothetical protein [Neoroseomonas terrae]
MTLTFGVAMLRGGRWELRPPLSPDRLEPGVDMPAPDKARLVAAIIVRVKADLAPNARK